MEARVLGGQNIDYDVLIAEERLPHLFHAWNKTTSDWSSPYHLHRTAWYRMAVHMQALKCVVASHRAGFCGEDQKGCTLIRGNPPLQIHLVLSFNFQSHP